MKRTLLLIIFILSFLNAIDAQWYHRSCGVTDINNTTSEEFECLWKKATKNVRVGGIITTIGISCLLIAYIGSEDEWTYLGPIMIVGGLFIDLIGIPIWIIGANRRSKLKKNPKYEDFILGSLNLSPALGVNQFNGTHYVGMSLSLNF
jgi:hypothetical protein